MKLADALEDDMAWVTNEYGGWWWAMDRTRLPQIVAKATAALEFFRQYAGIDSFWTRRAIAMYDSKGDNQSIESGARALGDLLRSWKDQVEAGIVEVAGARANAEIAIVSTDLMTQVRRLLEDRQTHPAAPIVLCGAALESALRAAVEAHDLELKERPSLTAFARRLREEKLFSQQDMKDVEQAAGLRNMAAHGETDQLSAARAGLMEQQTNLILRRVADLQT